MFACNIVMIPPNFRLVYTTSLSRPQLSLSLSSEPPWKRQRNGEGKKEKKKKKVIIIVNNEPQKKGTTMQKSWLKPTCCPKISWIMVTQVFILRLTFSYVITYFLIPFDWFQLLPTFWIQKTVYLRWVGVTKRIGSPQSCYSKWVQDQKHQYHLRLLKRQKLGLPLRPTASESTFQQDPLANSSTH